MQIDISDYLYLYPPPKCKTLPLWVIFSFIPKELQLFPILLGTILKCYQHCFNTCLFCALLKNKTLNYQSNRFTILKYPTVIPDAVSKSAHYTKPKTLLTVGSVHKSAPSTQESRGHCRAGHSSQIKTKKQKQ